MTCRNITEKLVESARREMPLAGSLLAHVRSCRFCQERLEAERALGACLNRIGSAAAERRSSAESREFLMARFKAKNQPRRAANWYWAMGLAAAVVLSVLAIPGLDRHLGLAPQTQPKAAPVFEAAESELPYGPEFSADPGDPDIPADPEEEGFIAVPYVPPLATGEMLRMVHRELNPAALASLGVDVDPAWTAQLPADLLLGEDGVPRAVRVVETSAESGAF